MEHYLDISKYTIYKIKTDNELLVAVPAAYREHLEQLLKEHGSLDKVPSSNTVRGIFIRNNKNLKQLEMLTATEQENDIVINQLVLLS